MNSMYCKTTLATILMLALAVTASAAGPSFMQENAAIHAETPAAIRMAGIWDLIGGTSSKERNIVEGIGSLLSSTREIDYRTERMIGESLALEGFRRYGLPVDDPELQRYVNLVGLAVARNSLRPTLPYRFVVVKSPLENAFACPGGIIFVSSTLVKTMKTEAQLACVLAHEVAHVSHKHALKSIRRAKFFQGLGKIGSAALKGEKAKEFRSLIGNLETVLFDRGLDKNMEFEADLSAMATAYKTGYGPNGMIEVLRALKRMEATAEKKGSWFSTHPPTSQRIAKCMEALKQYPDWKEMAQLPGRFYRYTRKLRTMDGGGKHGDRSLPRSSRNQTPGRMNARAE